ncbi:MAG: DUF4302 domain-containing protein [Prevotellaceae bacterium]|jgi:hypothetical protein|nr:DUF4302 domain-containing protein [Prevotellaceae bacterium]
MKKSLLFLTSVALLAGAAGCKEDDKYLFGATPDERIQEQLEEYQSILCSAPCGWLVTVGTQDRGEAGGAYRFWMKFATDNRVTMLGDVDETTATVAKESSYRLKQMQYPTLMFDTYTYIHLPDDPGMAIQGATDGVGLLSDSDVSLSGDISGSEFRAVGRKRQCPFIFTRATPDDTAAIFSQQALTALKDTAAKRWEATKYPTINANGFFMQMAVGKRLATFTYTDESSGEASTVFAPVFAEMDANIRLVEPFRHGNLEFDKIVWDGKYYRVGGHDGYIVFDYTRPSYVLPFGPNKTYNAITTDKSKLNVGGGATLSGPFLAVYDEMRSAAASSSFFIQSLTFIFEMNERYDEQMRLNVTYHTTASPTSGAVASIAEATFRVNRRHGQQDTLYFTGYDQAATQVNMDRVGPLIANSLLSFLLHSGTAETGTGATKVGITPSGNEFTVDWVLNKTPGLTSPVGGLYLTSDSQQTTFIPGTLTFQ